MLFFCVVAVGIHLVVLLLTSTGYIRDKWIDPKGAQERIEAAAAAKKNERLGANATAKTNAVPETETAATGEPSTNATLMIDDTAVPDGATNSAIIKAITEVAKPEDIPEESDLGIDLDDTRVR